MNGWRPISLMNVDIKLLAKVLAERLKIVCKEIIGEEQLAYVEGNDIHEGHLILNKVLEMARNKKLSGLMACIDFKAAFDSVRHKFIYTTLAQASFQFWFIINSWSRANHIPVIFTFFFSGIPMLMSYE